jgi:hypothetical protein
MMRTADYSADDLVFPLGWGLKADGSRLPRLDGFLDSQVGDIQTVLDVSRGDFKLNGLAGLHVDLRRLKVIFFHHNLDRLVGWRLVLTAATYKTKNWQKHQQEDFFHIRSELGG